MDTKQLIKTDAKKTVFLLRNIWYLITITSTFMTQKQFLPYQQAIKQKRREVR